jgi:hypothetical protein
MKAQVMKRAWQLAKAGQMIYGGTVKMYLSESLKIAWREMKGETKEQVVERLAGLGFKRWQKGNMDRMYVNATRLGLKCSYHRSGSIDEAMFSGEYISNRYASKLMSAKTYLDLDTMEIVSDYDELKDAAAKLARIA